MTTNTPAPPRPVMDDEHRRDERKGWSKARDLTGLCFGKLVVVKRVANKGRNSAWLCKCLCGDGKVVRAYSLLSGDTTSCGCRRARHVNGTNLITDEHRLNAATATHRNAQARRATEDVFRREPPDTAHVDRPGARLVRGRAY